MGRSRESPPERRVSVLSEDRIRLHPGSATKDEALHEAAALLEGAGAVTSEYLATMQAREALVSTSMGNGLAIPHGTKETKDAILASAVSFARYDGGVDWDGDPVTFVVGIAGRGDEHLEILSQFSLAFAADDDIARLRDAATPAEVRALLGEVDGGGRADTSRA